jgi:hypothetical protein
LDMPNFWMVTVYWNVQWTSKNRTLDIRKHLKTWHICVRIWLGCPVSDCTFDNRTSTLKSALQYLVAELDRYTVPIRKPNRVRLSNSILCQSLPFDSQTIQKPEKSLRTTLDPFTRKGQKIFFFMPKQSRLVRKSPVRLSNGIRHFVFTIQNPDTNPAFEWSGLA